MQRSKYLLSCMSIPLLTVLETSRRYQLLMRKYLINLCQYDYNLGLNTSGDSQGGEAHRELMQLGIIPTSLYPPSAPFYHSAFPHGGSALPSKELQQLYEVMFRREISEKYIFSARSTATNIIRNLFMKRMKDIENSIQNIPYIPEAVQLRSVENEHNKVMNDLTLENRLRLLCRLLQHDSPFVRHIALKKLYSVFVSKRAQIRDMVSGDDVGMSGGVYVLPVFSSISQLLQELLQLCSKESDMKVIQMCAKCLGKSAL